MIFAVIVACEIGFWVAIIGGLVARYVFGAKRLGVVLLACAPLIDVVLLVTVAVDLAGGATASWHHGLAAVYIGVSIAYGHQMIKWADTRFAHRFAGGAAPVKVTGWGYTRKCWADFLRTLGAVAIAGGILATIVWFINDAARTESLVQWFAILGIILAVDFLWAAGYTIWPRKMRSATLS
ncbi:MAG TPA: hypothetical protein VGP24_14360 [Glaciihabitans sp.]|jgi:hypothetical protein|nr:hypothetical protein [Glaciihabitans sp.]